MNRLLARPRTATETVTELRTPECGCDRPRTRDQVNLEAGRLVITTGTRAHGTQLRAKDMRALRAALSEHHAHHLIRAASGTTIEILQETDGFIRLNVTHLGGSSEHLHLNALAASRLSVLLTAAIRRA